MLLQNDRQKLINAVLYFIQNTRNCGKTKLFKLLYLLDFAHFKQLGRSVTGLTYHAWEKGPVPPALDEELDEEPQPDWQTFIATKVDPAGYQNTFPTWSFTAKTDFDQRIFSRRELRLLEEISSKYRDATAQALVDETHRTPGWERVWKKEGNFFSEIPYGYALDDADREFVEDLAAEREEMIENYA